MSDNDRVLISRLTGSPNWKVISNLERNHFTASLSSILDNECNDYVEYRNCAVIYRMVRRSSLGTYAIYGDNFKSLSPRDLQVEAQPAPKDKQLRDHFAGQVLAGSWEGRFPDDFVHKATAERVAEAAYEIADAMMRQRDKLTTEEKQ